MSTKDKEKGKPQKGERLALFKAVFEKYQDKFELHGYAVAFKEDTLDDSVACIQTDSDNFRASVRVCNHKKEQENLEASAKHEAIHLLVARFSELAENRHASQQEIMACEEELVRKLAFLIPDIE